MEKQHDKRESDFRGRLLKFLCHIPLFFALAVFQSPLFPAGTSRFSSFESLRIVPSAGQRLVCGRDIKFEVTVPSADVQPEIGEFYSGGRNFTFMTFRKTGAGNSSTRLELWFEFAVPGKYEIPPLYVNSGGRRYALRFSPVSVEEDIGRLAPQLFVSVNRGELFAAESAAGRSLGSFPAGKKIVLTLYLRYAAVVSGVSWEIPRDSIFERTDSGDTSAFSGVYSDKPLPAAEFEWTPLAGGRTALPPVRISASSYGGMNFEVRLHDCFVSISEGSSPGKRSGSDGGIFRDAFLPGGQLSTAGNSSVPVTAEDCLKIARLRSLERRALWGRRNIAAERAAFESSLGIPPQPHEFPLSAAAGAAVLSVIFCLLMLFSVIRRRKFPAAVFLVCLAFAAVAGILSATRRMEKASVSPGVYAASVPESSASSKVLVPAGTRVRIRESSGGWCYVESGDFSGWVQDGELIPIE